MTDTYELPELPRECSTVAILTGIDSGKDVSVYTADQMRAYGQECARLAVKAERERALAAVAALSTEARDREERDVIGRCWEAIRRAAAIRKG